MKKIHGITVLSFLLLWGWGLGPAAGSPQEVQKSQIQKAKIFQDEYQLISESDLYCSIYALEKPDYDIRVISSERGGEKLLSSDADTLYIDKGKQDGLEVGQIFLIVSVGDRLSDPVSGKSVGYLVSRRGKARIVRLEEDRGIVTAEKVCGQVMTGDFLVPFQEKEGALGKDEGFDAFLEEDKGLNGNIVYLDRDYRIVGSGSWGIIDLGGDDGLQVGQQLTVFKRVQKDVPRQAIGNIVVIDIQPKTATFKVLSSRDSLEIGFGVQSK
jgi:hypothetical protein